MLHKLPGKRSTGCQKKYALGAARIPPADPAPATCSGVRWLSLCGNREVLEHSLRLRLPLV